MKDKSGLKKWMPLILIVLVVVLGVIIGSATSTEGFSFGAEMFTNTTTLAVIGVGIALIIVYYVSKFMKSESKSGASGEGVTKDGSKISQYYDARFITDRELATLSKFNPCTWSSLSKVKKDGIVVRSKLKGGQLMINMYDPIHTMIIGTTGSGKTQTYINPSIRILSQIGTKPCMVITDPKGEVYRDNALQLKDAGYRIEVLDLRNPYASNRWNPMDNAFVQYHRALNIQKRSKNPPWRQS
jgi:type IV secretion system protein VirD4